MPLTGGVMQTNNFGDTAAVANNTTLAGSWLFTVDEIEVYLVAQP